MSGPSPTGPDPSTVPPSQPEGNKTPYRSSAEEVDVWWGSYAGRTMTPVFLFCGLLTAAIALSTWKLWDERLAPAQLWWHAALGPVVFVWLAALVVWCYRIVFINYRLTTRRLLRDEGFHPVRGQEIELTRVTDVRVTRRPLQRFLGIGSLHVLGEQDARPLVLEGVCDPETVAAEVLARAKRARRKEEAHIPKCPPPHFAGAPEAAE